MVAGIIASVARRRRRRAADARAPLRQPSTGPIRVPEAELAARARGARPRRPRRARARARRTSAASPRPAWRDDRDVALPAGPGRARCARSRCARAAVYAPGGRHPYPSSVVMGAVTARAAGVDEVVVAAPAHPVILAACALCGVDEVHRMGGAQAIAALAYGTETIRARRRDRRPGQRATCRRPSARSRAASGSTASPGRRDLLVLASAGADPRLVALDLLAQAEHGDDSLVVAVSDDVALLDARRPRGAGAVPRPPDGHGRPEGARRGGRPRGRARVRRGARARAPGAGGRRPRRRSPRGCARAGCLFVGAASATAFGDYVAGSNHTLPTDGAARFASGLTVGHFRRRMSEVRIGRRRAARSRRAGVPIADAEGFAVHAESMSARIRQNP